MKLTLLILPAFIVGWILVDFIKEYATAAGSTWQRVLAAGKGTATIVWMRLLALVSAGGALLANGADYLNAPQVADAIRATIANHPEWVLYFGIFVAIVGEMARRRNLPKA